MTADLHDYRKAPQLHVELRQVEEHAPGRGRALQHGPQPVVDYRPTSPISTPRVATEPTFEW